MAGSSAWLQTIPARCRCRLRRLAASPPGDRLKVLHFSATDGLTGAGGAAARIHQGLLARGVQSRFCVAYPTIGLPNAFSPRITLPGRIARKVQRKLDERLLNRVAKQYDYLLSTGAGGYDIGKIVRREQPDIVQLHLIGFNAFKLTSLSGIQPPVVWRLCDQWAFCGIAHCEPNSDKYVAAPPQSANWLRPWTDLSEHVRYRKQTTYNSIRQLVPVCPSRWMTAEAKRSALFRGRPIASIPTGCDTEVFAPRDRRACRSALGLPLDAPIVLVGAGSLELYLKGLDIFIDAINRMSAQRSGGGEPLHVVTFGKDAFAPSSLPSTKVHHLGHIVDRRLLSIIYSAADVFAAPSRIENLANTVLESLACGTPAVAFNIGGMPDMIDHQINGYLATPYESASLAEGMQWCLDQRHRDEMRVACREKVLADFSPDREIESYISLYEGILSGRVA